ncbi:aminoacyl-tRNA hydrolase [Patescibacteria group bacterium]|nr:aminoacyl-tRNA hydrolase [Patescibacteria group bacterium]MBU1075310.1 aminoacyl-tRNA hydrolase [Patescibacteria group bacterium]MBU1951498.1 aminoacyl-tRNA hydrolase [Patescibacteria group bacterium]
MKLIVGLGNPGRKYKNTRHNIGWLMLDELIKSLSISSFKTVKKFECEVTQGKINDERLILAKPLTFMNKSGKAVGLLKNFYKIDLEDIIIVRDDLDLELGKYREKQDSGSGGHNGINSIIEHIGSKGFTQIKVGIKNDMLSKMDPASFVLQKFTAQEKKQLKSQIPEFVARIQKLLE